MKANIPDFPYYHITTEGRLYSCKRRGIWHERKSSISNTGRVRFRMKDSKGKYWWKSASRLVAEVYIPNPHNYPVVMHLDNNPLNNSKGNLKWGTQSDNIQQAYDEHRAKAPQVLRNIGELHAYSKISNEIRYILVDLYLTYKVPIPKLSKIFGISKRHITKYIHDYRSGIRW